MKNPAVYIMASQRNGTLYIGVTSNLIQRVWQHREGLADGFTKQYGLKMLVWYEQHETMESAISREKAMKKWLRKWKLATIEKYNPSWTDLWPAITGSSSHPDLPVTPLVNPVTPTVIPAFPTVIPAHAGIQNTTPPAPLPPHPCKDEGHEATQFTSHNLDSRMRGNDDVTEGEA